MAYADDFYKRTSKRIKEQAAGQGKLARAYAGETERQQKLAIARQQAIQGGAGGALAKIQQSSLRDLGRDTSNLMTQIGTQKSQQLQQAETEAEGLREAERQRRLQREQLAQQESQFKRTLQFQEGSFAKQMDLAWKEFGENQKTNFINAATAMKQAGLNSAEAWKSLLMPMGAIYPGRTPSRRSLGIGTPQEDFEQSERRRMVDWISGW